MRDIWIYQLTQPVSAASRQLIESGISQYLSNWKSHGTPVPGSAEILHDHFVVVRSAPGSTSGCSIDDMNRNISTVITQAGFEIAPPNQVFYQNGNGPISQIDFREIGAAILKGELGPQTTIFSVAVSSDAEMENFALPLERSWVARFLPKEA
ncbi:MAG: hypothetical protein H6581_21915 [Bacteroidia bacterium]|nr:hypothetical protein [Bacteroidia bacterium]